MNNKSKTAVVVLNWNNYPDTKKCLSSFHAVDDENIDIILVDNASADGSGDKLASEFPKVVYIPSQKNLGYSGGNNLGLRYAVNGGYQYILLLNNDTEIIDQDFIGILVSYLDDQGDIGAVGPAVKTMDGGQQDTILYFPSIANLARVFLDAKGSNLDESQEVESISGCCVLVRSLAVQQAGYIDENYFLYGEETEWFYRMRMGNWRIAYLPVPSILHFGASSTKQMPRWDVYLEKRSNIVYTLVKHRFRFQAGIFILTTFLVLFFRIIKNIMRKGNNQQPGFKFSSIPEFFSATRKKWILANDPG